MVNPSIKTHTVDMNPKKRIALIAHDYRKDDLLDWVSQHREKLEKHELFGTGTTGGLIADKLGLEIHRFMSGPLGGDLQIGAAIAENKIDMLIFFWDPIQPQPHDVDIKALLRIAVVYNVPMACDRSSADFMISSPLLEGTYGRYVVDYSQRLKELSAINLGE